jgi:hypothetical protein
MDKRFHEVLGPLLEGWTITKVESGTVGEGDPAKITATRGAQNLSFEVFGGVYGPVVTNVQQGKALAYRDVVQMFESITEHVLQQPYEENPDYLDNIEDPFTRRLGFKSKVTEHEWWVGLVAIKESQFAGKFRTGDTRRALALELSQGVGVRP